MNSIPPFPGASGVLAVGRLTDLPRAAFSRVALAVGVFDGVHLGHRRVLTALTALAEETQAAPVVLTFDPHPRTVLHPESALPFLLPLEERLRLLHQYGAAAVVVCRFSRELADFIPEDFLEALLCIPEMTLTGIAVGRRWRFGRGGRGNSELLRQWAETRNFRYIPVDEMYLHGEVVSSSAIRRAVAAGKLEQAAAMLGRPFSLYGKVEHGYHIAGPTLAHPTANLATGDAVLPPDGVYAGRVCLQEGTFAAAVNIGIAPTFSYQNTRRRVEIHVLDFSGDLYDAPLQLELLAYLRPEQSFASPEALKEQINRDIRRIRTTVGAIGITDI